MKKIQISPSLLAADFTKLAEEVADIGRSGADYLHLDVMDGCFVPNISFGFPVIESLKKVTEIPFDVHLMIERPERYLERFVKAGADILTFHYEASENPAAALRSIRSLGCRAAISIKPNTPAEVVFPLLSDCDMVLVMTVEPGFGGQSLIPETLEKVRKIKAEIVRQGLSTLIEVDGGISPATAPEAIKAGSDILVAGSSVFKAEDRKQAIEALR